MAFQEEFDYQILKLTDTFYEAYPNPPFTEILKKRGRAYNCLLIQTDQEYLICIPYRTHISHSNAYHFKRSARSRKFRSGLDYSKAVIIQNLEFIGNDNAIIDHDEYMETVKNIQKIKLEATSFISDYCLHIRGEQILHENEFKRRYMYSPLKYFHRELGL